MQIRQIIIDKAGIKKAGNIRKTADLRFIKNVAKENIKGKKKNRNQ
jgi:hypothetical protein